MGAKGVVCLADERVCANHILILRKSMVKFEPVKKSDNIVIGVVSWAKKLKAPRYNRQLIQVLEHMHKDIHAVIFKQFKNFYDDLRPDQTTGMMEYLTKYCVKSSWGRNFRLGSLMSALTEKGLEDNAIRSSFLWNTLQRLRRYEYSDAKFQAQIPIPGSYKVLGVCDEYDVLNEGQIYVRAEGKTIAGKVLIYRSPVIHPGDVQLVHAVDDNALQKSAGNKFSTLNKLDNVVVFSTQGARPLPTMLSGQSNRIPMT